MDQHSAELYRAGEDVRSWFVDYWQKIARVLEVAGRVNEHGLDEVQFISDMEEAVLNLRVVDPIPRLTALDKQLNKWRGATMEATYQPVEPAKEVTNYHDQGLLGQIVLLSARTTLELAKIITSRGWEVPEDQARSLMEKLAALKTLSQEAAPWQD